MSKDEAELREVQLNIETLRLYHFTHKLVKPETFKAREGLVVEILDQNYGIARCDQDLVLFDTCDVWINPSTRLSQTQNSVRSFFKIGDQILINGTCVSSREEIPYIATAVWIKTDDVAVNDAMKSLKSLLRHQV